MVKEVARDPVYECEVCHRQYENKSKAEWCQDRGKPEIEEGFPRMFSTKDSEWFNKGSGGVLYFIVTGFKGFSWTNHEAEYNAISRDLNSKGATSETVIIRREETTNVAPYTVRQILASELTPSQIEQICEENSEIAKDWEKANR